MACNHVMLDLETLGNDVDGVVTSIGAVAFDPETGELGSEFYVTIDARSSIQAGRTVTAETLKWWFEQEDNGAKAELFKGTTEFGVALTQFKAWFLSLGESVKVWGNGPTFDVTKLETAFGYYNIPWKFYNVRCVRTIRDLGKELLDRDDIPFEGDKHHALADAKHQAQHVSALWKLLKKI